MFCLRTRDKREDPLDNG